MDAVVAGVEPRIADLRGQLGDPDAVRLTGLHLVEDVVERLRPRTRSVVRRIGAEDENGPRGNIRHHNDLVAQCEYGFDKIKRVLAAHGANMNHVVKVTSYLTDMKNRVAYGQCLGRNFGTAPLPVHTLIGVASLAFPEMMVETDVTAITPD